MANEALDAWHALRRRSYAEEGIPMILGVETVGAAPPRRGDAGVAEAFRALSDVLTSEGAGPADILEVVAARSLDRLP